MRGIADLAGLLLFALLVAELVDVFEEHIDPRYARARGGGLGQGRRSAQRPDHRRARGRGRKVLPFLLRVSLRANLRPWR